MLQRQGRLRDHDIDAQTINTPEQITPPTWSSNSASPALPHPVAAADTLLATTSSSHTPGKQSRNREQPIFNTQIDIVLIIVIAPRATPNPSKSSEPTTLSPRPP
jgi:hypothetical protein